MALQSYSTLLNQVVRAIWPTQPVTDQQVPRVDHEHLMTKNSAGGMTYVVSDEDLIDRILILGTNSNTYYATAQKLTDDAIASIKKMISEGKGEMIVSRVKDIYKSGRAPKQDPTLFVLALLTQTDVPEKIKKSALECVVNLRILTHLYTWIGLRKSISGKKGFGRAIRTQMLNFVKNRSGIHLAYLFTKYRSRKVGSETWSIDDIIKCAHIPSNKLSLDRQLVIIYIVNGLPEAEKLFAEKCTDDTECLKVITYLRAVEETKNLTCAEDTAIQFIRQYHLPREVLSTHLLKSLTVWQSLLFSSHVGEGSKISRKITMPITALIRNLGVMSTKGMFDDPEIVTIVDNHIKNKTVLKCGYVHPVALLIAKTTYETGHGVMGKLVWDVNKNIVDALEDGFYEAFGNIEGTGKRILHAVDCSGSMRISTCAVPNLTACQAVATLVMEAVRRESKMHTDRKCHCAKNDTTHSQYIQDVVLFNDAGSYVDIKPTHRLNDVMSLIQDNNFGTTDCSQPMLKALELFKSTKGIKGNYDGFIVYTDNETYCGNVHPAQALEDYRKETGINAKLVVVATTPTAHTIAPHGTYADFLCLNVTGFDLNGPTLIRDFLSGTTNKIYKHIEDNTVTTNTNEEVGDDWDTCDE